MKVLEKKPFMVYNCGLCESKLEAEVEDVVGYTDYEGDSSYWIACPVCGGRKYLPREKVPPKVLK